MGYRSKQTVIMNNISRTIYTLLLLFVISSCDDPAGPVGQAYDRSSMLEFTAKQTIIPLYEDIHEAAKRFDSTLQVFAISQSNENLQKLRDQWRVLAFSWQYVVMFDFGPAQMNDGSLFQNIGTFPVSVDKIESYINVKDTTFKNFDRDSRGIYALEYLIFKDSNTTIQAFVDQPFRVAYAKAISRNIVKRIETVLNQWQGSFSISFIDNDGTQAGSSISDLYNSFVYQYEIMKNYNLGLPMGKRAGQTTSESMKVEGYYSCYSTSLLFAKYEAIRNLWFGYARLSLLSSLSAKGFKDYLYTVENGPRLITDTEEQWNRIGTVLQTIDTNLPLQHMISTKDPRLEQLYLEMTKHTRFIKSEMSSLLGISITFSSSDGD